MRYILGRLVQCLLTVITVLVVVFVVVRLTGDPARLMLPLEATPDEVAAYRKDHGLDQPIPVQLVNYLAAAAQGDFGSSLYWRQPVREVFLLRLPATVELAVAAMLLAVVIGLPLGVISAVFRDTVVDFLSQVIAVLGQSVPVFISGIFLILIFSVDLHWLPVAGDETPLHLVMPAVTLSSFTIASLVRITRSAMLEVLDADYLRTARAKGLHENLVVIRHALPNALIPVLTLLGMQAATLLTGTVVTETLFAWPGVGRAIIQAILQRDFPVVQGAIVLTSMIFVITNLLVDLLYGIVDPRVRKDA